MIMTTGKLTKPLLYFRLECIPFFFRLKVFVLNEELSFVMTQIFCMIAYDLNHMNSCKFIELCKSTRGDFALFFLSKSAVSSNHFSYIYFCLDNVATKLVKILKGFEKIGSVFCF